MIAGWAAPVNPPRYTHYEAPDGSIWVWDQPRGPRGQYLSDDPDTFVVESAMQWLRKSEV